MKTLEIKHLAAYLPYGLKVFDLKNEIHTMISVVNYGFNQHIMTNINGMTCTRTDLKHVKPILRNLSDLTKEIEHNGERFVPIGRLLDIAANLVWSKTDYLDYHSGVGEYWCSFKDNKKLVFGYNVIDKYFYSHNKFGETTQVFNQLDLFNFLYSLHFDIFGLIDAGLAIDMNTLK